MSAHDVSVFVAHDVCEYGEFVWDSLQVDHHHGITDSFFLFPGGRTGAERQGVVDHEIEGVPREVVDELQHRLQVDHHLPQVVLLVHAQLPLAADRDLDPRDAVQRRGHVRLFRDRARVPRVAERPRLLVGLQRVGHDHAPEQGRDPDVRLLRQAALGVLKQPALGLGERGQFRARDAQRVRVLQLRQVQRGARLPQRRQRAERVAAQNRDLRTDHVVAHAGDAPGQLLVPPHRHCGVVVRVETVRAVAGVLRRLQFQEKPLALVGPKLRLDDALERRFSPRGRGGLGAPVHLGARGAVALENGRGHDLHGEDLDLVRRGAVNLAVLQLHGLGNHLQILRVILDQRLVRSLVGTLGNVLRKKPAKCASLFHLLLHFFVAHAVFGSPYLTHGARRAC
mmetsp:Transcript_2210/g.5221  ORF Transcript_2210/g.5221 Transcript_2210/m.5221 type:complete len:396 (-) Transcript_2210:1689-2876(-)